MQEGTGSLPFVPIIFRRFDVKFECRVNLFRLFKITQGAFGQRFSLNVNNALILFVRAALVYGESKIAVAKEMRGFFMLFFGLCFGDGGYG